MKEGKSKHSLHWCCVGRGSGLFWGLLFLALGLWFLAEDLGYISSGISIWPIVLIFLGIWFLLKRNRCF